MKRILLFESFKSNKLSKTLSYVKYNKESFLDILRDVLDKQDFPYSEITDDFFEYLPYSSGLKKFKDTEDKPCSGDSIKQFGSSGIEGEKCNGGRIKRMWGSRQRVVECNQCHGSGIEPKNYSPLLVKFWFSSEGEYLFATVVDGSPSNSDSGTDTMKFPYKFNHKVQNSWNSSRFLTKSRKYQSGSSSRDYEEADFCLVLDLEKLYKREYTPSSFIRAVREVRKSGSLVDKEMSNEEIKKRNLDRYFSKLSTKIDVSSDVKSINKVILRSYYWKYILINLLQTSYILSDLRDVFKSYIKLIEEEDSQSELNLEEKIKRAANRGRYYTNFIEPSLQIIREDYKNTVAVKIFDRMLEISDKMYKLISQTDIQNLEDFELIIYKISNISEFFDNNELLTTIYNVCQTFYNYDSDSRWSGLKYRIKGAVIERGVTEEQWMKKLDYAERFIIKTFS